VVSGVLRRTSEDLSLVVLEHASVGLADNSLLDIGGRACLGQQRNLEEHAACQVHTLKELEVDVHVERQLSLLLEALLLGRHLVVSLHHDALGEQLLLAATAANLLEGVLSLVNETLAESTETNLDQSSVVKDLALDVKVGDVLLKMRHQHHVTSLVVLAVEGKEVNLTQHSSGTNNAVAVAEKVVAKNVDEVASVLSLVTGGDDGLDRLADGLPAVLLEGLDNLGGLKTC
jgi:hypothetical protein